MPSESVIFFLHIVNPFKDELKMHWRFQREQVLELEICDLQGRPVLRERVEASYGEGVHALPIGQLPSGVYLYRLRNGDLLRQGRLIKD